MFQHLRSAIQLKSWLKVCAKTVWGGWMIFHCTSHMLPFLCLYMFVLGFLSWWLRTFDGCCSITPHRKLYNLLFAQRNRCSTCGLSAEQGGFPGRTQCCAHQVSEAELGRRAYVKRTKPYSAMASFRQQWRRKADAYLFENVTGHYFKSCAQPLFQQYIRRNTACAVLAVCPCYTVK